VIAGGECRGEAPIGERAAKADELRRLRTLVCEARFRARHFRMATSGNVARTMDGMRLSALRLPYSVAHDLGPKTGSPLFGIMRVVVVGKTRTQSSRGSKIRLSALARSPPSLRSG